MNMYNNKTEQIGYWLSDQYTNIFTADYVNNYRLLSFRITLVE